MKKTLVILSLLFSSSLLAATSLICTDQNSEAVYQLDLNDEQLKLHLSPLVKDSSTLSLSEASLTYNEGESGDYYTLFEGKNNNRCAIVVELNVNEVSKGKTTNALVFYSKESSHNLNQKTVLSCSFKRPY